MFHCDLFVQPGGIQIKSVAMFSPQPLWLVKEEGMRRLRRTLYFQNELWYNFLALVRLHKLPSLPMKCDHIDEFLLFCTIAIDRNTPKDFEKRMDMLMESNIPLVIMYGSEDSVIGKPTIDRMNHKIGKAPEDIIHVDPNQTSPSDLKLSGKVSSFMIDTAKHFAHANYYKFSNEIIQLLLDYYN